MVRLSKQSARVLTDPGSIREEALPFNTPGLVMRTVIERPEGVKAGEPTLVRTDGS